MNALIIPFRRLKREATDNVTELSPMPRTRGDCVDGPRPCPHYRCRHNLVVEVTLGGGVRMNFDPEAEPDRPSCVLDVADQGPHSAEEVGQFIGTTRQRIQQHESRALRKLRLPLAKMKAE